MVVGSIAKSWNGASIENVLEKVTDKIGHKPEYVISDFTLNSTNPKLK